MSQGAQSVTLSALTRVLVFDLSINASVLLVWIVIGAVDWRVIIPLTCLRCAAWVWHLSMLLRPAQDFERCAHGETDDAHLLALDAGLQVLFRRLALGYASGWVACFLVAAGLARAGLPTPLDSGKAEYATGGLILLAAVAAGTALLYPMVQSTLLTVHERVGGELLRRRLNPGRPVQTLGIAFSTIILLQVCGCLIGMGALGGLLHMRGLRTAAELEQRHQVELALISADAERATLPGIELVGAQEVGAELRGAPSRGAYGVRSRVDATTDTAFAAAPLGTGGRWVLASAPIEERTGLFALGLIALTLLGALPGVPASRALTRLLLAPIKKLGDATERFVNTGELGELNRLVPLRNDELGRVAVHFNAMLDTLEALADVASAVARGDLRAKVEHPGALHDAFRAMLSRITQMVDEISGTALAQASAATQIHATTQRQLDDATQQRRSVGQVTDTVSSLAAAAEDIATQAAQVFDDARRAVETGDEMVARIAALSVQVDRIGELLEVIREVAKRSDLLALNGSLEATRAGEAGRGFALVAAEMRRLAERVTGTVANVREQLAEISSSSAGTVDATERSRDLAQRTAEAAQAISELTRRQSADTSEASLAVVALAQMVVSAVAHTEQTQSSAELLHGRSVELERLIAQFETASQGRELDPDPGTG